MPSLADGVGRKCTKLNKPHGKQHDVTPAGVSCDNSVGQWRQCGGASDAPSCTRPDCSDMDRVWPGYCCASAGLTPFACTRVNQFYWHCLSAPSVAGISTVDAGVSISVQAEPVVGPVTAGV